MNTKTRNTILGIIAGIAILVAGIFIGSANTEPEVREVEVTKDVPYVPQECKSASESYKLYGDALVVTIQNYEWFIEDLRNEFNGINTPQSKYVEYGNTIREHNSLAGQYRAKAENEAQLCTSSVGTNS